MLEHSALMIGAWRPDSGSESTNLVRAVLDGAGAIIGFARQTQTATPHWLRWLSRRGVDVFEIPDNSLLFTLRRRWGWPAGWHVVDADERLVGILRGRAIFDGFGHFLAVMESPDIHGRGLFFAKRGTTLGEYEIACEGTGVSFAAETEGNPFARMLLLGAVLAKEA